MSADASEQTLDELIASWELQQNAYVRNRSDRFEAVIDAIAHVRPHIKTLLDIGAGPGSFSKLLLQRFTGVTLLALDYDPAMLRLAEHNLREHRGRVSFVDADLRDEAWPSLLGAAKPDAVVSSTALHWLPTADLVRLYVTLAEVLGDGALFFNADHLPHSPGTLIHEISGVDDRQHQTAAFSNGVPDWDGWWEQLRVTPGFSDLITERERRFPDMSENRQPTRAFHIEALRSAGFREVGTLWQCFDDYVVYAAR